MPSHLLGRISWKKSVIMHKVGTIKRGSSMHPGMEHMAPETSPIPSGQQVTDMLPVTGPVPARHGSG